MIAAETDATDAGTARRRVALLCTACVLIAPTAWAVFQRGMFLDGITYAVLARNLAEGAGSLWKPFYTASVHPEFYEQLPFGIGAEAILFRLAGDHVWVERAFSLAMFLVAASAIALAWRQVYGGEERARTCEWLPLLVWGTVPLVVWAATNNMLENTVTAFAALAVWASIRGVLVPGARAAPAWGVAAGLFVVAAVLCKGPIGLFPLATAPIACLVLARWRQGWRQASAVVTGALLVALLAAALVLDSEQGRSYVSAWASQHLLPAIRTGREAGAASMPRIAVPRAILLGILGPMLWLPAALLVVSRGRPAFERPDHRPAALFFAIGLCASLPVMVSAKQAPHYLVPSVPFFAMGVAALILPTVSRIMAAPGRARFVRASTASAWVALAAVLLVLPVAGARFPRNAQRLQEIDEIGRLCGRGGTLRVCPTLMGDWGLHAYAARLYQITLVPLVPASGGGLVAVGRAGEPCVRPSDPCTLVSKTVSLDLYRCEAPGREPLPGQAP